MSDVGSVSLGYSRGSADWSESGVQTSLCDTQDELDTVDVDSLTEAFAGDVQDTDEFYRRIVSSDEEYFGDPDDGSIADNDGHLCARPCFVTHGMCWTRWTLIL